MCVKDDPFAVFFSMKMPCSNCPFRKEGAISLMPGRVENIAESLINNDLQPFLCHKTLNASPSDDDSYVDDEGPTLHRTLRDGERMCAGAAAFLMKHKRPTVGMRAAFSFGSIDRDHWAKAEASVIDPLTLNIHERRMTRPGQMEPPE
jgi:hypothetical protein